MKSKQLSPKKDNFNFFLQTLLFLMFLFLVNCKDRNEAKINCGCDSNITRKISSTGKLFYKNTSNGNNFNNRKYWIVFNETNCGNCMHNLIICNESLLNTITNIPSLSNVKDIIGSMNEISNAIDVTFTGDLKTICNPFTVPADYTYDNITITQIQKQKKAQNITRYFY